MNEKRKSKAIACTERNKPSFFIPKVESTKQVEKEKENSMKRMT